MPAKTKTATVVHERHEDGTFHPRPDLTQCDHKTDKGRRCKLNAGHAGDHAMVLRGGVATPPSLAELRAADSETFGKFVLSAERVPVSEDVTREYTARESALVRDSDQKRADGDALKNYEAWVRKGSPVYKTFEEYGKAGLLSRYLIPPAGFNTVILMLRRATQSGGPVNGKKLAYRRKAHVSGNAMVYFVITDKPIADENNGNS